MVKFYYFTGQSVGDEVLFAKITAHKSSLWAFTSDGCGCSFIRDIHRKGHIATKVKNSNKAQNHLYH